MNINANICRKKGHICWLIQLQLTAVIALFCVFPVQAELFEHQLQHQSATTLIPVIKPHLSKNSSLSGTKNKLFVNGSKQDNEIVSQILKSLDAPLNRYFVEIRILNQPMQANQRFKNQSTKAISSERAQVITYRNSQTNSADHFFTINVTENNPSFIATGEQFPSNVIENQYGHLLPGSQQKKVSSGFYLTVFKQANQQIALDISAGQQQRQSRYGQKISRSAMTSKIVGNKDQWLLIASTSQQLSNAQQNGKQKRYRTSSKKDPQRWYYARISDLSAIK